MLQQPQYPTGAGLLKTIIILTIALALASGGWLTYYFSDKEVIKRQLNGVAAALGKEEQETTMQMALKMGAVKNMLAASCLVIIPEQGYSEALAQDLIIQYLLYHRNRHALLTLALEDLIVDMPAKGQAAVQTTVSLHRRDTIQAVAVEESHQVQLLLTKGEKKWLLQTITMPEALVQ